MRRSPLTLRVVAALAAVRHRRRLRHDAVATPKWPRRRRRCSRLRSGNSGQAKLDRLDQDEHAEDLQRLCRQGAAEGRRRRHREGEPRDDQVARRRQVCWATGRTAKGSPRKAGACSISDDPAGPSGANCYACHQLAPQELSFGTIGPSLYQFGKLRGYDDEIQKYAYGKLYNAEAYSACTQHAALRSQGYSHRAADQGCRRAADGPAIAGEQVKRHSPGAIGAAAAS